MKSIAPFYFIICLVALASCTKNKEPKAAICADEPVVITTADTLELENCSENFDSQRWDLPNGAFSDQKKVAVTSATPATYLIKLSVSNDDFANNYIVERKVKIISKNFTTAFTNHTLPSLNSEITICTVVDDIDANDPEGYYAAAPAPSGYRLVADLGNGCYKYELKNPANPPTGVAVTYHYFCIDDNGGFCDTTKVFINTP